MKKIIRTSIKAALLCYLFLLMTNTASAQPPPDDDDCGLQSFGHDIKWISVATDPTVPMIPLPDTTTQEFEPCTGPIIHKNITFIHGLGGSVSSWDKQKTWTDDNYKTAVLIPNYNGHGWEESFHSVGLTINDQIGSGLLNGVSQTYPERCVYNDFAITHSQGGIAARFLDWKWDVDPGTFGDRKFYGIVTFGTPHAGADVALTRDQHNAFVQNVITSVFLKKTYNYKGWFAAGDQLFNSIDDLIRDQLAPILLQGVTPPTLKEMEPGSPTMNHINNHNSQVHKVAFYGVENSPECWRIMDNIVTKASEDYPIFTATDDQTFGVKVNSVKYDHTASVADNSSNIKRLTNINRTAAVVALFQSRYILAALAINYLNYAKINQLITENIERQKAIDFLNNANSEWRYLIGSYHRHGWETVTEDRYIVTWFYITTGLPIAKYYRFKDYNEALDFYNSTPTYIEIKSITTETITYEKRKFFPSDGIVLQRSQVAYPGVGNRIDIMKKNNHFQERNSPETLRVMLKLYDGDYDFFFFTELK